MVDDFCLEVEILQVRKEGIQDLSQSFPQSRSHLLDEILQSPGKVADEVERKREYGTQYWGRKAGKKNGHGRDETNLDKNIKDGYQ